MHQIFFKKEVKCCSSIHLICFVATLHHHINWSHAFRCMYARFNQRIGYVKLIMLYLDRRRSFIRLLFTWVHTTILEKKTIITGSWPLILYQVYQLHDPVVPDHATNRYQAQNIKKKYLKSSWRPGHAQRPKSHVVDGIQNQNLLPRVYLPYQLTYTQ